MSYEEVPDFYKLLKISRDADKAEIEVALKTYEQKMRENLNIPHLMKSSRRALDELLPVMQRALLSDREHYDQRLKEDERKRTQPRELNDGPRLDDRFRFPFFFDRYNSIDTEEPAHTLREMAEKMDRAWPQARTWLTSAPAEKKHPLVLFIKHTALRNGLARRIEEEIIQNIALINADEALERCLYILNPEIEHPSFAINGVPIQSGQYQTIYLGESLPDESRQRAVTLTHAGGRGCLFGTVESLTDWVKLSDMQPKTQFWLLPETNKSGGITAFNLPLLFDCRSLARNTVHTAMLVFHIDNYDPPIDIFVQLALKILVLPPRVTFEPASTQSAPLFAGATKRGAQTSVTITPHNNGDEGMIPLVARLHCPDPDVEIDPPIIYDNRPITITIGTQNRTPGSTYPITVYTDYSQVRRAKGTEEIYIRCEVLPTPWRSMIREKSLDQRVTTALAGVLLGSGVGIAAVFATRPAPVLGFLLLPLLLLWLMRLSAKTLVRHRERAGETSHVPDSLLWLMPILAGVLLVLVFLADSNTAYLLGAIIGALIGGAVGFITDQTLPGAQAQPPVIGLQAQPGMVAPPPSVGIEPQAQSGVVAPPVAMEHQTQRQTRSLH